MKILLADDDPKIQVFIRNGLRREGYTVEVCGDGECALGALLTGGFDAAILDIMMPKLDGLSVIKQLRDNDETVPILILSAKTTVDDRVAGLRLGGDDYLVKPFAFSELAARVQSLVRRVRGTREPNVYRVADLTVDLERYEATRAGRYIELQAREFALLHYLVRNTGRVVSKAMVMENVWGHNFDPQTNVVESRICRLRGKIDEGFDVPLIHTIRGVGYVLRQE